MVAVTQIWPLLYHGLSMLIRPYETIYENIGATPQIMKKRLTVLFRNVYLTPVLLTLRAINAAPLSCTSEVGIPLVTEANKSRLATIKAMTVA